MAKPYDRELQDVLDATLRIRDEHIQQLKKQFDELKTDFKYNLGLLSERDKELDTLQQTVHDLKLSLQFEKKAKDELDNAKQNLVRECSRLSEESKRDRHLLEEGKVKRAQAIIHLARQMREEMNILETELAGVKKLKNEACNENKNLQVALSAAEKALIELKKQHESKEHELQECKSKWLDAHHEENKLTMKINKMQLESVEQCCKYEQLVAKLSSAEETALQFEVMARGLNKLEQNNDKLLFELVAMQQSVEHIKSANSEVICKLDVIGNSKVIEKQSVRTQTDKLRGEEGSGDSYKVGGELERMQNELMEMEKQNCLLREVIKEMRQARQEEAEEERIRRLEESVRILKECIVKEDQPEMHLASNVAGILNAIRQEMTVLKGRNWHRVTKHEEEQNVPTESVKQLSIEANALNSGAHHRLHLLEAAVPAALKHKSKHQRQTNMVRNYNDYE